MRKLFFFISQCNLNFNLHTYLRTAQDLMKNLLLLNVQNQNLKKIMF
jgi:hypothetical protein